MDAAKIAAFVRGIVERVKLLATRGVVRASLETTKARTLEVEGLARDHMIVEHLEPFGFSSSPRPGAEVVLLAIGSNREHVVAIVAADRSFRPAGMQAGEVQVHDDQGQALKFEQGGKVTLLAVTTLELRVGSSYIRMDGTTIRLHAPGGVDVE